MTVVNVQGVGRVKFPDGMDDAQISQVIEQEIIPQFRAEQEAADREKYSPTAGMGTGEKMLVGVGKAFSDIGRGTRQFSTELGNLAGLGRLAPDTFGDAEVQRQRADEEEHRRLDAPLMQTGAGKVGNLLGNVALAAPAAFVPGTNTVVGAGVAGAGLGLLQPTTSGGERAINAGLGAGLGMGGQWAGSKVGRWAADKIASRRAAGALEQSQNSVRDQTLQEGMDAGFTTPPATTNPTMINTALESVAGKAATQGAASVKNQKVTNQLVRADLGIADSAPLTRETLKAVRTQAGSAYEAVKQSGDVLADQQFLDDVVDLVGGSSEVSKAFPGAKLTADQSVVDLADSLLQSKFTAKAAVEYSKRLRSMSRDNFKAAYAAGGSPEKLQLAKAQWNAAGALEDAIERNLQSKGLGDLAGAWTQARTTIAKSYSAEAALNEGTGNIMASKLVQQMRKGKPMSGGFEKIAKFASAAPKAMAEPTQSTGVSALNAILYGGGAALGSPGVLALPLARLLTKRAILSKSMQKRLALPNYTPNRAGTAALQTSRGLGRVAGPLAGSAYAAEQ